MKAPLLIFIICFLFSFRSSAVELENNGIQFFQGSWSELLEKAKKENKPIFIDVYTDWCAPCKQMDKEVLPSPGVGKFYNASFISFKLNAEKGEGIELAKRFNVAAYPTYLFLDQNGFLLHRAVGYFDIPTFIGHAEEALKEADKNLLNSMEKQFTNGYRELTYLREYIQTLTGLGLSNKEVLNAYFQEIPLEELTTQEELSFMAENLNDANANALPFVIKHYGRLDEKSQKQLSPKLYSSLVNVVSTAYGDGKPLQFKQALDYLDQLAPSLSPKDNERMFRLKLLYAAMVKDALLTKQMGYGMVGNLMDIPVDSIKAEDKRRYTEVMTPYWNGTEDSTKIEGFQEEKEFLQSLYSKEISGKLYEASKAFVAVLAADDDGLKDAIRWINQLLLLQPDVKLFIELKSSALRRYDQNHLN